MTENYVFLQGPFRLPSVQNRIFISYLPPSPPLPFKAEVCVRVSHEFRYAVATGSSNQSALHGLGGEGGGKEVEAEYDESGNGES